MAKLQTPNTAGFNAAGNGYNVKLVKINDIVIDPEIAGLFNISDKIKDGIVEQMKQFGYNKEEPVTLWGKILVDGRTRYTAAKEAGLKEIPAVERNFESRDDAIMHTYERQSLRRNLTSAEILKAAKTLLNKRKAANGDMSLNKGYKNRKQNSASTTQKPEVKFNADMGLPENVRFLKSAVILLVEKSKLENGAEIGAAILLINHFLKKNEKCGFCDLLPEAIKAQLPRLPLVAQDY